MVNENSEYVCSECGTVYGSVLTVSIVKETVKPVKKSPIDKLLEARLRKINVDQLSYIEDVVNRAASIFSIPSYVKDELRILLTKMKKLGMHISHEPTHISAYVYIAYRMSRVPISLQEIAKKIGLDYREVQSVTINYIRELYMNGVKLPKITVEEYIKTYAASLSIPVEVVKLAVKICNENKKKLNGKQPNISALACIYKAGSMLGQSISVAMLARRAMVSETSIYQVASLLTCQK